MPDVRNRDQVSLPGERCSYQFQKPRILQRSPLLIHEKACRRSIRPTRQHVNPRSVKYTVGESINRFAMFAKEVQRIGKIDILYRKPILGCVDQYPDFACPITQIEQSVLVNCRDPKPVRDFYGFLRSLLDGRPGLSVVLKTELQGRYTQIVHAIRSSKYGGRCLK